MYRKYLRTEGFQASLQALLIAAFILCTWSFTIGADSTAIDSTVEAIAASLSDTALSLNSGVDSLSVDSVTTVETTIVEDSTEEIDTVLTPKVLKEDDTSLNDVVSTVKTNTFKQSRRRKQFITFAARLRMLLGKKIAKPLTFISRLGVHRNKILFLIGSLIIVFVSITYYQQRKEQGRFMTTTRLSIMDKEVQRACKFIEEHYHEPELNLEVICSELVTGGAFLEALFMKELGLTIDEFITQVRVNRAKIELRKKPNTEADILAEATGFSSEETFRECFKAISGTDFTVYQSSIVSNEQPATESTDNA